MKKTIIIFAILGTMGASIWLFTRQPSPSSFATPALKPPVAELNKVFPTDSRSVLEQSDQFILYSIKSHMTQDQMSTFHYYPIVGKTEIKDKKLKSDLIAHLYAGIAEA